MNYKKLNERLDYVFMFGLPIAAIILFFKSYNEIGLCVVIGYLIFLVVLMLRSEDI